MKIQKYLFLVILFLISIFINASQHFISNNIKRLNSQLSNFQISKITRIENRDIQTGTSQKSFFFKAVIDNKEVNLTFSEREDSTIMHIGVYLFDVFHDAYSKQLYLFIERYFLEKLLNINKGSKYSSDEIDLFLNGKKNKFGNTEIINLLNNRTSVKINSLETEFEIEITDSIKNSLLLVFPKNYSMIFGMDKKELDELMYSELSAFSFANSNQANIPKRNTSDLTKLESGMLVSKGSEIFEGINNFTYYSNDGGDIQLIYNKNYLPESLRNFLQNPELYSKNINVQIEQHMYGGVKNKFEIDLSDFLLYFQNEYKLFVGIESIKEDTSHVVLAFFQKDFNYLNLAVLSISSNLLFNNTKSKKIIYGDLYAYIRTDNIGNIFKEFSDKKSKYNIKVINE